MEKQLNFKVAVIEVDWYYAKFFKILASQSEGKMPGCCTQQRQPAAVGPPLL